MNVVFHPLAERELIEAARFYEARSSGLGADFLRQVERALDGVAANPAAGRILTGAVRRRLVNRFPFAVLYQASQTDLTVIAIAHLHRRPGYWKKRLGIGR